MNIPNILTALRFVLIPIFGYALYNEHYLAAIILFTLGGITDILDGYIARKYNLVTSFGKLADPIADKLMQITALILMTMQELIPGVVLIVVVAKEIFMGLGSISLYKKHIIISSSWYGKLATVVFYFAIIMTIIFKMSDLSNGYADMLVKIFIGVAVASTLFAFVMYVISYRKISNKSK